MNSHLHGREPVFSRAARFTLLGVILVVLDVADGEFVTFVGPSGCGKSTTLRIIAGLETATGGDIWIGDKLANDVHAADRDVAMVFQSYALYPHMTVYDNIAYGLRRRAMPRPEIQRRVADVAGLLKLDELMARKPAQLSGGQRQRVALGRAIVRRPAVFLMDEPLSNLDAQLRAGMRAELLRLHARLGTTVIYVTHDQVEAMTMSQRVMVMNRGRIEQLEAPLDLYREPETLFVARFLGTPAMNLISGTLSRTPRGARFEAARLSLERPGLALDQSRLPAIAAIRPQQLTVSRKRASAKGIFKGPARVDIVEHYGAESFATVLLDGQTLIASADPAIRLAAGDEVSLRAEADDILLFDEATGRRIGGTLKGEIP